MPLNMKQMPYFADETYILLQLSFHLYRDNPLDIDEEKGGSLSIAIL